MKKLANLKGVKTLSRIEQKQINGGIACCTYNWRTGYTGECCPAL